MEFNHFANFKSHGQRYLSPLARAQRRQAYIPKNLIMHEVKDILQKIIDQPKSVIQVESVTRTKSFKIKIPSSPQVSNKKIQYSEKKSFRSLSPCMRVKKSFDSRIKGIACPIVAKKLEIIKNHARPKLDKNVNNSNYTSYSNIYKVLLEKVPLIC